MSRSEVSEAFVSGPGPVACLRLQLGVAAVARFEEAVPVVDTRAWILLDQEDRVVGRTREVEAGAESELTLGVLEVDPLVDWARTFDQDPRFGMIVLTVSLIGVSALLVLGMALITWLEAWMRVWLWFAGTTVIGLAGYLLLGSLLLGTASLLMIRRAIP